jgi:hypothetical protein
MTTQNTHGLRIAGLEKDSLELGTRLNVLELALEKGFASLEKRFDTLEQWLAERL